MTEGLRGNIRNIGLIDPVLDHADEQMRFAVRTTDLKPLDRDDAPAPDRIINRVDDGIELLGLGQELMIPPFDQIGGRRGEQLARGFSDDVASRHADHSLR